MPLLVCKKEGIYCPKADVYIDPWRKVDKAFITHAHADHARRGSAQYVSTHLSVPILKQRLSSKINIKGLDYGEVITVNGVKFSFHPAGHIIGSAQIRVESEGEIWVASGDYKTENDGISGAFEPIACHHFITESTFGLPVYHWPDQMETIDEINQWWNRNKEEGITSIIYAYSLGKAQRILFHLDESIGPVYTHAAVEKINQLFREQGLPIGTSRELSDDLTKKDFKGAMIIAPGELAQTNWLNKMKPYKTARASGWMMLRGMRRRMAVDRGFVLSDHADWHGLNQAVKATGAENIYVTHGSTEVYTQWLNEQGYKAQVLETEFKVEI